jgi:GT2 family glycosyltransferase
MLRFALAALARQTDQDFEILVVSQGEELDSTALSLRKSASIRMITDPGNGLSRARNLAWRATQAEWVAFVDDDCALEPDWMSTLKQILAERVKCCMIAGQVIPANTPEGPYLPCGVVRIRGKRCRRGRWQRPLSIGGGAGIAIRRETIAALDGWDERLGTGSQLFPAGEDEDFNYRLLRAGGTVYATQALRTRHVQWRQPGELAPLFRDYMIGRAGAAVKHLRSRDPAGGAWLLTLALLDCLILLASAARFGVRFRLRIGCSSVHGLFIGIWRGLRVAW